MAYLEMMDSSTGFIDPADVREKGKEHQNAYSFATPFPHVVLDDFLPLELCERLLSGFVLRHDQDDSLNETYNRAQERAKTSYHPDTLAPEVRALFYAFNSRPFIKLIENITGINGLIPDPYFSGGGLHELRQGGHLSMHADFNHHHQMNLERRVNVLIYLNKDWKDEYGGQLELWDTDVKTRYHSIVPILNRCVIFNTTSQSMHGNPQPIAHPDGISRKSVALYYYTATWDDQKRSRTTQFKVRPGSEDKIDWWVKMQELKLDLLPPIVVRHLTGLTHRLRRIKNRG
jgi:hypothetical protein